MEFISVVKKFGLLLLGVYIPLNTAMAVPFSDVPSYHKHNTAISTLSSRGIIRGYNDGGFKPSKTISRAEAVKVLTAAQYNSSVIDGCISEYTQPSWAYVFFSDVPNQNAWYPKYVCTAKINNIVGGYPDGTFRPNNTINFAEGLKIILEGYGVDTRRIRFQNNSLIYVKSEDWFARYFSYAYGKNLINRSKFYHPAQLMTRGEFAEIIYRLQTIKSSGLSEFPSTSNVKSNEYTITIPKLNIINLNVSFADLYDSNKALSALKNGLGHYLNPPGSGKKMVIFGHSSGYNWDNSSYKQVLKQINQLQNGDKIYINYKEKGYIYNVNNHEVLPASRLNTVLKDYGYEEMALYTCWPPNSVAKRYVIYANRM